MVHRQPDRRHGRRHTAGRDQSRRRRPVSSSAIRTSSARPASPSSATTRTRIPAGAINPQVMTDAHAADLGMTLLHRQAVPRQVPGRLLLGPARLVEPHQADRRARAVHLAQARRHGRQDRGLRRRLARRRNGHLPRPAGRRADDEGRLAAGLRRLSPARSTASPTTRRSAAARDLEQTPGMSGVCLRGPSLELESCRTADLAVGWRHSRFDCVN